MVQSEEHYEKFRKKAESLLQKKHKELESLDPNEIREVLHELQVHRIELELQNDELRKAQHQLESSRLRFARLFNNAPVGYVVLDRAGVIRQSNKTFLLMTHREEEVAGTPFASFLVPEDESVFRARYKSFFRNPSDKFMDLRIKMAKDSSFYVHLEASPHHQEETDRPSPTYDELLVTVSDISQRKLAEEKVSHLNRVLLAIRNVNQLIVHEKDRAELIRQACHEMTQTRGYRSSWIVLFGTESGPAVVSHSGLGSRFAEFESRIIKGEYPSCVKRAMVSEKVVISANPHKDCRGCDLYVSYGEHVSLAARMSYGTKVFGVLGVSVPQQMAADLDEHDLLAEVAGDLAFALHDIAIVQERARTREALRASEALLKKSQEIARVGSWELDIATEKLTWADEVYRIFGLDPNAFPATYQTFLERVHPMDRAAVEEAYSSSLADRRDTYKISHRIVRSDTGEIRYVHEKCEHVRDASGNIVRSVGMVQDITEAHQAEQALFAEKERLAVTLGSIGDGVITTDTEGKVVILNKVAQEITGWSQEDAAGKTLPEVFPIVNEFTRKPCVNPVEQVLLTGEIIELSNHTMLIARDGTERIIADSGAPIRNTHGDLIGVVLVFRDVTEKEKILAQMQRAEKLDSLGVLAGGIAHDFNNLLSGIFGYLDMARESITPGSPVAKYVDKALSVFNRSKDLTQQLLTFSKGGVPVRKTGDLSALVTECSGFVLSGSNVGVHYRIDDGIWPCDYDENQISQVIDNVVINAQQAMPMGGTVSIQLENRSLADGDVKPLREGRYVCLSVTDQGVGIPPEVLDRIFDPYFTTKQKGSGLGLATCYSIIQKHDGHIVAESKPGTGTTIRIFLPASSNQLEKTGDTRQEKFQGTGHILIMDDEDFILEVAGEMLQAAGFTSLYAKSGEDALEMVRNAADEGIQLKAALLDLTIPGGMGGKETVLKLKEKLPELPVFASSGYSEDPVMAKPQQFGFTDSIRKPYRRNELWKVLAKYLNQPEN